MTQRYDALKVLMGTSDNWELTACTYSKGKREQLPNIPKHKVIIKPAVYTYTEYTVLKWLSSQLLCETLKYVDMMKY